MVIHSLINLRKIHTSSFASRIFQQCFKSALVTPILKKRCLDHNDLNNYRPVYILCFIAKILQRLVLSQVSSYLNSHNEEEEEEKLYFNDLLHFTSIHIEIHDTVGYCGKQSEDKYVCIRYSPMKQN